MSRLQVRRKTEIAGDCIIGELFLDDTKLCNTLEPSYTREPHPAIPAGTYRLCLQKSGEVYGWMSKKNPSVETFGIPLLENVPGRSGVEIHIGNTSKDTLGCTLLGQNIQGNQVLGSTVAYARVYPTLRAYINEDPDGTIDYIDIPAEAA